MHWPHFGWRALHAEALIPRVVVSVVIVSLVISRRQRGRRGGRGRRRSSSSSFGEGQESSRSTHQERTKIHRHCTRSVVSSYPSLDHAHTICGSVIALSFSESRMCRFRHLVLDFSSGPFSYHAFWLCMGGLRSLCLGLTFQQR